MRSIALFIFHLFINVINDYLAQIIQINPIQITFFRFATAAIIITPFITKTIYQSNIKLHILRGMLLLLGIILWIFGLKKTHLSSAIAIGFMSPIFLIIFERILLGTNIPINRLYYIIIGFIGIIFTTYDDNYILSYTLLIFITATICFSTLDIITRYIAHEPIINNACITYSTIAIILLPYIIYYNLYSISLYNLILCILLGINSNIIIYCITYAYQYNPPSFYGTYRYLEIIFSFIIQYVFTKTLPSNINNLGIIIIIITAYLYHHNKK